MKVTTWPSAHPVYALCEISNAWNRTPYWVASLPVSIVPDHSDIFRPELFEFIKAFLPSPEVLRAPSKQSPQRTLRAQ